MKRPIKYVWTVLATILLVALDASGGNVMFKAKLDSATLLMGHVTTLHLEITQDAAARGYFPNEKCDTLNAKIEIASKPIADTVQLDNHRVQINRDLIIQSFDSGLYVIKPIPYVVNGDTAYSNQLTLKVLPVDTNAIKVSIAREMIARGDTLKARPDEIHDLKPVEKPSFRILDYLPNLWWVWLLALVLLAGALLAYMKWFRKGVNPLRTIKKRLPPYEEAILNLQRLKAQQLWQQGQEKEYFTGLTDILRVYIDRRFGINAVEMTSSQIVDTLKKNDEAKVVNEQLEMILEVADFVKFANARPLADDNEMAYQRALNFVEATRPVVEADAAQQVEKKKEVRS